MIQPLLCWQLCEYVPPGARQALEDGFATRAGASKPLGSTGVEADGCRIKAALTGIPEVVRNGLHSVLGTVLTPGKEPAQSARLSAQAMDDPCPIAQSVAAAVMRYGTGNASPAPAQDAGSSTRLRGWMAPCVTPCVTSLGHTAEQAEEQKARDEAHTRVVDQLDDMGFSSLDAQRAVARHDGDFNSALGELLQRQHDDTPCGDAGH